MIPLMRSTFFNEQETKVELCKFITNAGRLSMGDTTVAFEEEFSKYQNRSYSVFFNSGSSANLALIQSLLNVGVLKKGDEVGFSAVTWATNLMPLLQLGLTPIPIDVSLSTLNCMSDDLDKVLHEHYLKCFFLTDLLGFCGDIDKINNICRENNIVLIEDACESLGSIYHGRRLGNYGVASTFSFFVGHHLSTIEGGMVCTNDKRLYDTLQMVRAHGWTRNVSMDKQDSLREEYHIDEFHDMYTFYSMGYNLRPTEIQSFLGLHQLGLLHDMNRKRQENFKLFSKHSSLNPDFYNLDVGHMDFVSNFAYPIICKDKKRFEQYKKRFQKCCEIRPIVGGSMLEQPFFQEGKNFSCPNAKIIHDEGFYFPNNPDLTEEEKNMIVEMLQR